ncbi:MAG: adenine phosphoribosyltransferase [Paludibacteraceae bacterium]|nr:adenine phosphoribosyltransferase [Paludibacteraceae bacterium]
MTAEEVKQSIRNVPDYPIKGIQFKDITTALAKPACLKWMRDELVKRYKDLGITQVVGIESRGFIIAPAVAMEIGAGFVPIRKPGKLPAETIQVSYTKEYGTDSIEMHKGALNENDIVLVHDDILATGGSLMAAIELIRKAGVRKIYANCLIELEGLNGRKYLADKGIDIYCLFGIEVDE